MDHLALAVHDQERSRSFYERYLGFVAEAERRSDGALMLHHRDFSLALGPADESIDLPSFLHFGQGRDSPEEVRAFRDRLEAEDVEIVGWWDEPGYVSVKFRDPDGYVVEVSWDADSATGEGQP
jgi:catechol 2,3-dioxygenase-like lactoylglutathione lyase family enzyme